MLKNSWHKAKPAAIHWIVVRIEKNVSFWRLFRTGPECGNVFARFGGRMGHTHTGSPTWSEWVSPSRLLSTPLVPPPSRDPWLPSSCTSSICNHGGIRKSTNFRYLFRDYKSVGPLPVSALVSHGLLSPYLSGARYVDLQPVGMGAFGLVWYVIVE